MPVTEDAEHWTFRASENISEFGQPYEVSCQGQVQWDRVFYLYNVVAKGDRQGKTDPKKTIRYTMECITKVRARAREFGWVSILWIRERIAKDGTIIRHAVPISIEPGPDPCEALKPAIQYLQDSAKCTDRVWSAMANTAVSLLVGLGCRRKGPPDD